MERASYPAAIQFYPVPAQRGQEYETWRALFHTQSPKIQEFLESQGSCIAWAIVHDSPRLRFWLPDQVICGAGNPDQAVPEKHHEQRIGSRLSRLTRMGMRSALQQRLNELEEGLNPAAAAAAGLLRFAIGMHLIHRMIQPWWSMTYQSRDVRAQTSWVAEDSQPEALNRGSGYGLNRKGQSWDADRAQFIPADPCQQPIDTQRLPGLLEACAAGMAEAASQARAFQGTLQGYQAILNAAVNLAPYVVADEDYQHKRYLIAGQLVQQGRALAHYQVSEIIRIVRQRAMASALNRGLSLSLPYFDDHALEMRCLNFRVIPAGRTQFSPVFVVRAAWLEEKKVEQDPRLSHSTRQHLLEQLKTLERAFDTAAGL
jgi:hypothetical protein